MNAQVAMLTGGYFSRESAVLIRIILARRFSRPALVRETSRSTGGGAVFSMLFHGASAFAAAFHVLFSRPPLQRGLSKPIKIWTQGRVTGGSGSDGSSSSDDKTAESVKKMPNTIGRRLLEGIVFADSLRESVADLALSLSRAHARSAPLRHVLLYGPPGTGKTMVARRLAELSGLDYAVMSGGDLGPLGQVSP
jgi:hypothetical protein